MAAARDTSTNKAKCVAARAILLCAVLLTMPATGAAYKCISATYVRWGVDCPCVARADVNGGPFPGNPGVVMKCIDATPECVNNFNSTCAAVASQSKCNQTVATNRRTGGDITGYGACPLACGMCTNANTTAFPSAAPTTPLPAALGGKDTNQCPAGSTPIGSAAICQRAAGSVNARWSRAVTDFFEPKGCYLFAGGTVYFNDHAEARTCQSALTAAVPTHARSVGRSDRCPHNGSSS